MPSESETIASPLPDPEKKRSPLLLIGTLAIICAGAVWGFRTYEFNRTHVSTDDAFVVSDLVFVNAAVPGQVDRVAVTDNQIVKKGDLLVHIEDSNYRAQLAQAQAQWEASRATLLGAVADMALSSGTTNAQVTQATGGVDQGSADVSVAASSVQRSIAGYGAAASDLKGSKNQITIAATLERVAIQNFEKSKSLIKSAQAKRSIAIANVRTAQANLKSAQSSLAQADREATRAKSLADAGALSTAEAESKETIRQNLEQATKVAAAQLDSAKADVLQKESDLQVSLQDAQTLKTAVTLAREQRLAASQNATSRAALLTAAGSDVTTARAALLAAEGKAKTSRGRLAETQISLKKNDVTRSNRSVAKAKVNQALASLNAAKIAMGKTSLFSPVDGIVSKRIVQTGQQVNSGDALLVVIPTSLPWIIANFKETQLAGIRAGLEVDVVLDAYPGLRLKGKIDSISRGTGSTFALLPPDNATGNFTKVVQRVPVKITIDPHQAGIEKLSAGLSCNVSVKIGGR